MLCREGCLALLQQVHYQQACRLSVREECCVLQHHQHDRGWLISYARMAIPVVCACRQLKSVAPGHVLVQRSENADEAFRNAASAFEVSA